MEIPKTRKELFEILRQQNSGDRFDLVEKRWRLGGQQVGLLMNVDFCPFVRSGSVARLDLCINHSNKCGTVVKIQDKQVTKLWYNDRVYHSNLPVP
jgi:hypothetical protein